MNLCEIVEDLLPLYVDGVCSQESRNLVSQHTAECASCRGKLAQLENHTVETTLHDQGKQVVLRHEKAAKRKSVQVGIIMSAILMVPVLVCLIVNLAVGHGLDWFFIVLTSLMVFGSLTVTPLVVEKRKFTWTLGTFTVSLLLLLMTCAIYTHGDWFLVAASASVFGLSVVFLPFALPQLNLGQFWNHNKGLLTLGVDTILYMVMMVFIGFYVKTPDYRRTTLAVSLFCGAMIYLTLLWFRYVKLSGWIKAGVYTAFFGVYTFLATPFANHMNGNIQVWPHVDFSQWNEATISDNTNCIIMLCCIGVGILLTAIGVLCTVHKRKKAK
jgi:hypothetical protein